MAKARVAAIGGLIALAAVAGASGPCEEDRAQTGLALAPAESGLAVSAVDEGSAAESGGLRTTDRVLQVNGTKPRGCADFARTVRDARREGKALLVLVRRGDADVPLALGAATWDRAVAAVPPSPPAEAPNVRAIVAAPPPAPLPPEVHVSVEEVTHGIGALPAAERPSGTLAGYRQTVGRLQREVETLSARGATPPDVVAGLRTVLRYYDAAGAAWASAEAERESARRPRHVATAETVSAPYFEGSDVAAAIDEFPFLRETVVREPGPGLVAGESAGAWRPLQARALLWQHGRDELGRLTGWLAAGER